MIQSFLSKKKRRLLQEVPVIPTRVEISQVRLDLLDACLQKSGAKSLIEIYLTAEEQERFQAFGYKKRRNEWLGGRIAAKHAVMRLLDSPGPEKEDLNWRDWSIAPDDAGRPYMHSESRNSCLPEISISHSGDLAIAMATKDSQCGIDVQKIVPTVGKVRDRFSISQERAMLEKNPTLSGMNQDRRLSLLWSAKEAFRKAFSATPFPGFMEMRLENISGNRDTGWVFDCIFEREDVRLNFSAICMLSGEYSLALTCVE